MPFWKDLTATRQLLSDAATLTVNKITSDQDIARLHNDAQVWSVNHLAKVISGDDPMQAIVDLVAEYWARTDEGLLVSCLKGMFAAGSMSGNLLAIHSESVAGTTSATKLNGSTFVDACAKLGDRSDRLTAVAMHSVTEAALRKLDLIDFIPLCGAPHNGINVERSIMWSVSGVHRVQSGSHRVANVAAGGGRTLCPPERAHTQPFQPPAGGDDVAVVAAV